MSTVTQDRPTALLSVKNLKVALRGWRGDLAAIRDVSFDIRPGEVLSVVGESGAGKSLTGSAIVNLLVPPLQLSGGEVWLDGRRIDNLGPREMEHVRGRDIGMVFQDPLTSLDPLFTIGDQLVETIRSHLPLTAAQARQRAIELLHEVGIPSPRERMDFYPHQFSGGMRQRIVIALAVSAGPRLLIADEPTTALDVSVQAQIISLLRRMCREREMSVLLITHDMGVVAQLADRVAVMYAGRIVEMGPVSQVIGEPRHPYAASLMSSIPSVASRRARLKQIPGAMPRLEAIPNGCAFNPRCVRATAICRATLPPLDFDGDRHVACWHADPARTGEVAVG